MLRSLFVLIFMLPLAAFARDWQVDTAKSSLTFQCSYQGQSFQGKFARFKATIAYDANALDASKFDVTIDLASVDTTSTERDDALTGADFFDTGKFPQAHFVTSGFAKAADGSVEAQGQLTIRNRTRPVTLKVAFAENGNAATLDVTTTLKRADFDLGAGSDWKDVGAEVPVHGHLLLSAQ